MIPKLNKNESVFRNEYIFAADAKAITLDNTLINLFMLMRNNGSRIKLKLRNWTHTIESLKNYMEELEKTGAIQGYSENKEAAENWLRSNLVNMVNRGNLVKENVSSLRPVHIESYRVRNAKYVRDYNSADQVYLMLSKQPHVLNSLKDYLSRGWDNGSKTIVSNGYLDVDTVGVLHLMKNIQIDLQTSNTIKQVKPLLEKQADLFCDDVKRLLVYKNTIPRSVFIEYLRTLVGFHLSLYFQKLIYLLPKMVKAGKKEVEDDWTIVADVTDNLNSRISGIACKDMENTLNGLMNYIKATIQVNSVMMRTQFLTRNITDLNEVLSLMNNRDATFDAFYENKYGDILNRLPEEADRIDLEEYLQYENTWFDKYVQSIMLAKGRYQHKYSHDLLDKISMKNTDYGFMADGRSRKHPRRAILGARLLETLVQLLVLEQEGTRFYSHSLSIEDLISKIRQRYGIIIDGLNEPRFAASGVSTHLAFKENVEAFKNKLRQIGFYTDLSDAYILQKIHPRYKFNAE